MDKMLNMKFFRILFFLFALSFLAFGQDIVTLKGLVVESNSNLPLSFANIRVSGSTLGTAANRDGEFNLKLKPGHYKLIASYIGFVTDTISVELKSDNPSLVFKLNETKINLPEIVVTPGINPAYAIIRNAILKKKERDLKIQSYEFNAYTKGLIRTQDNVSAGPSSITLGFGSTDSSDLKITGIIENQSTGYYRKPDEYKELILARKQTANFPPTINILTGGRLIQNFYKDDVNFFGRNIPGPLSDNALEYYDYYLEQTIGFDNTQVFKIHMYTANAFDPGFEGYIYITDNSFFLSKVNLQLNRAANPGGLFDTVNVFQQFSVFDDSISMPVDYRLLVNANYLGLAKFGFEINTILYNYKINNLINENIFNKAIVTVLPDADEKDSLYWQNIQNIPNTGEEETAYQRIDSLENIPRNFWDDFSLLSTRIQITDNFSTSAPISMYHFNPVEGHALDYGLFLENSLNERLNSSLNFSYGFSDKKFKTDFYLQYLLGNYRTTKLSFKAFNKLKILFGDSDNYNELTSTLLALLSKYSFREYFYSKGISAEVTGEVLPELELGIGLENFRDLSTINNSDYSFFNKGKSYKTSRRVDELHLSVLKTSFKIDPRNYIEDGFYRRRVNLGNSYYTLEGTLKYSNSKFLKSEADFTKYDLTFFGVANSFGSSTINLKLYWFSSSGRLPFQLYYSVPGNFDLTSKNFSFRTLNVNEVLLDRGVTLNFEYNFRDELFKTIGIPGLKNLGIQMNAFFNVLYSNPSGTSNPKQSYLHPFYETGFSIGHLLVPLQLEFGWKLNYLDGNNFRIGFNSIIL